MSACECRSFLNRLGQEIVDPEEETFLLFSQSIPSHNLGFVDSRATELNFTIDGQDILIHQSPTILSSNRGGGTTGAVIWKITPLFASWITSRSNPLWRHGILKSSSSIIELGCGISGLIGLSLGRHVYSYTLTDQDYTMRLLNENLQENRPRGLALPGNGRKTPRKAKKGSVSSDPVPASNIKTQPLDWELDEVTPSLTGSESRASFDVVITCDCIYNDALIAPLVQACTDVCRLRERDEQGPQDTPTLCIVAQQLRSAEVFDGWLTAFHKNFRVWRMPDEELTKDMASDSGYVVHVGVLR
ncbi:hypothetical protein F5884DRAFT_435612 [Xylogone sp. PMI_703]|nr:hypothetical protein F5884DRAFT_435612 [Xylogone sp. PMI_703]